MTREYSLPNHWKQRQRRSTSGTDIKFLFSENTDSVIREQRGRISIKTGRIPGEILMSGQPGRIHQKPGVSRVTRESWQLCIERVTHAFYQLNTQKNLFRKSHVFVILPSFGFCFKKLNEKNGK